MPDQEYSCNVSVLRLFCIRNRNVQQFVSVPYHQRKRIDTKVYSFLVLIRNEQALVCLSNRAIVDAFIAKWRITVFFSNCLGLIYLAIYPPSIITANERPPSASTDFFNFSETRACSLCNPTPVTAVAAVTARPL